MTAQLLGHREREPDRRHLREVVEQRTAITRVVAVGHLDDQARPLFDHVRRGAPARHDVGAHGAIEHLETLRRIERPERLPFGDVVATPDVVDQNVDPTALADDACEQRGHVVDIAVIGAHGNAAAAGGGNELRALFDRLAAPGVAGLPRVLRPLQYTVAPASPSIRAMPRPAARVAPATTAIFPVSGRSEAHVVLRTIRQRAYFRPFAFTNGRALSLPQRHNRDLLRRDTRCAEGHSQTKRLRQCSQRTHATCARICSNFAS